jgi:hypothetical protein
LLTPFIIAFGNSIQALSIFILLLFFVRINRNFIGMKEVFKSYNIKIILLIIPAIFTTICSIISTDIGYLEAWLKQGCLKDDYMFSSFGPIK